MKILALETSAAACSAALCQDGTLLAQSWQNSGLTHSRTLLPLVDSMLKNCGASLKEVEVIAVAAGPGSFTGLRIGVATAKGLAWPEDKPCAPCSTLESMAWPLAHLEGRVIVCAMDARRSQVYNALFLAAGEGLQRLTPDRAIGLDQLGEELKKVEEERRKGGVAGQKDTPGQEETAGQRAAARQAGTASKEMCTFLIINISSLQLIPMNMIVYRSQYGCFLASNFPYFQRVYSL